MEKLFWNIISTGINTTVLREEMVQNVCSNKIMALFVTKFLVEHLLGGTH